MLKILHLTTGKYLKEITNTVMEYRWLRMFISRAHNTSNDYNRTLLLTYEDETYIVYKTVELSIDEFEVIDVKDTPHNYR